jgi:hypothetical protein
MLNNVLVSGFIMSIVHAVCRYAEYSLCCVFVKPSVAMLNVVSLIILYAECRFSEYSLF